MTLFALALRIATSIIDALKYLWNEYVKESCVFLPTVNDTDTHGSFSGNNVKTIRPVFNLFNPSLLSIKKNNKKQQQKKQLHIPLQFLELGVEWNRVGVKDRRA